MEETFSRDKDFFSLLRAGLWGEADGTLSARPDWGHIYRLANEHKVQGVIAEGITAMGMTQGIPADVFTRLITDRACIIKMNVQVNRVQAKLCAAMDASGIPYAVLKGQAVAQSYAKPEIRRSGDIDFLIRETDFERVNELFSAYTDETQYHHHADLHHALHIDGVWVENHAASRSYFTRRLDRVLQDEMQRIFVASDFDHYDSAGQAISIPNPQYTTLFLMGHILRHMTTEGISLKQLCDWVMYIHSQRGHIDRERFSGMLRDSGILNVWKRFSVFAVEWLGMDPGFPLTYESGHPGYGSDVWGTITAVREIRSRSKNKHIGNFWLHYLDSYRDFIKMNNLLWRFSKAAFFERLWDKFGALPVEYLKRTFRINGVGFRKDRFTQTPRP